MTKVIEADEMGRLELPDELMQAIQPLTKYVVEANSNGLVIYPQTPILTEKKPKQTSDEWEQQWRAAQEQVSKSWPTGVSAVDVISEMREPRGQGKLLGSEPKAQR